MVVLCRTWLGRGLPSWSPEASPLCSWPPPFSCPSSSRALFLFLLSIVTTFCSTVSYRFFLRKRRLDISSVFAMKEKICEPTLRFDDGDSLDAILLTLILTLWLTWSVALLLTRPWVRFDGL